MVLFYLLILARVKALFMCSLIFSCESVDLCRSLYVDCILASLFEGVVPLQ